MRSPRLAGTLLVATQVAAGATLACAHPAAAATGLQGTSIAALATFAGRIWAGTDSGLEVLGAGGGAWTAVGGPLAGREVDALAVSDGWLVVGTGDGALRSRDGSTWVAAGLSGERVASLAASGTTLLAGTGHDQPADGAVQRSDDSGATWTAAPLAPAVAGLPGETVQAVLTPSSGAAAWAATAGGGTFQSPDARGGWSGTSGMASNWVAALWRDPARPTRVLAGSDDGLYAWGGSGWTAMQFPQADPWVQALATGPGGYVVAGTYDGALYAQGTGGGWTLRASGMDSVLSVLAVAGGGLLVGTSNGVACVSCPTGIAAAASSPGGPGATGAPSLPPPGARAGASPLPGATAAASPLPSAGTHAGDQRNALTATGGNAPGGASALRWGVIGGLIALAGLGAAAWVWWRPRRGAPGG